MNSALESAKDTLNSEIELLAKVKLDEMLRDVLAEVVEPNEKLSPNDIIVYVYTSGTTGLPKPAVIKQSRCCAGGLTFFRMASFRTDDVVYITLPLYHATGGIIGIGAALVSGA